MFNWNVVKQCIQSVFLWTIWIFCVWGKWRIEKIRRNMKWTKSHLVSLSNSVEMTGCPRCDLIVFLHSWNFIRLRKKNIGDNETELRHVLIWLQNENSIWNGAFQWVRTKRDWETKMNGKNNGYEWMNFYRTGLLELSWN